MLSNLFNKGIDDVLFVVKLVKTPNVVEKLDELIMNLTLVLRLFLLLFDLSL